jgi:hypothetical protein
MKKVKKLGINSLIKEFELLDEKQNAGTLGGSYYYDKDTGAFLGHVGSDSAVRFIDQGQWEIAQCYYIDGQGSSFSEAYVNPFAKETVLRSFLPASAQYVTIQTATTYTSNALAAFINNKQSGSIIFGYDPLSSLMNDYNNLQSVMFHESYHWNNGHIYGTSNYSGYSSVNEVDTIMAQINDTFYKDTTNDLKIRTAKYLYDQWGSTQGTLGYTETDARRIAGVK